MTWSVIRAAGVVSGLVMVALGIFEAIAVRKLNKAADDARTDVGGVATSIALLTAGALTIVLAVSS